MDLAEPASFAGLCAELLVVIEHCDTGGFAVLSKVAKT